MGGVRTALYNYLFARKHGGDFILRIEDTDQARFVPGAEAYIVEALNWCGIKTNEGIVEGGPYAPYRQSERKAMYSEYALQLIQSGHAYYAFDSPAALDAMREKLKASGISSPQYNYISRESMNNSLTLSQGEVSQRLSRGEPYVIRIKIPRKEEVRVVDMIRGNVVVHTSQMDDKVLFKSDGMPTYHLANVVDDHLMQITHVIRGEEWLPSAPLHVLLYRYLGWEDNMPAFAHLPLLLRPDGNGKLSKRDGDRLGFPVFPLDWQDPITGEMSSGYREKGYFAESFVNMIALLGWNPGDNREMFTMDELVEAFRIDRISKSGAKFDINKAKWFNHEYVKRTPSNVLASYCMPILEEKNVVTSLTYVSACCDLLKDKMYFIHEFWSYGHFFFVRPEAYDEAIVKKRWNSDSEKFLFALTEALATFSDPTAIIFEQSFKTVAEEQAVAAGSMMQIFRLALTGEGVGPALFETAALLGKEEVLARVRHALASFIGYAGI